MAVVGTYFVPDHGLDMEATIAAGDRVGVFHLYRYVWAWNLVRMAVKRNSIPVRKIWDLGCGSGYGCRMVADRPPADFKVTGIDTNPEALRVARDTYAHGAVQYVQADLDSNWETPGFPEGPADVILCFNLIEFLVNRDLFMLHVSQVLAPHGLFLFSTPCHGRGQVDYKPEWSAHKILFSLEAIRAILCRYFDVVQHSHDVDFPGRDLKQTVDARAGNEYSTGDNLFFCRQPKVQ